MLPANGTQERYSVLRAVRTLSSVKRHLTDVYVTNPMSHDDT